MNWIDAAILSPAVLGATSITHSHILSRRVPSLRYYLLVGGTFHLTWTLVALVLFPLPGGVGALAWLAAMVSGLFRGTGVTIMYYTMRSGEVSQIIPVIFTYPVFVALMAVPLLGETLTSLQWLAISIVVAGAVIVSFKKSPSGSHTWMGKVFLLLLVVSLLYAIADITGKYALAYFSSWNMLIVTEICFSIVWLAVSLRPRVFKELNSVKQRRIQTIPWIVSVETVAVMGVALLLWAMERGPVSLVSTISGSRPIFVAVFSLILSRLAPKFIMWSAGSGMMLALRLIATAMIVVGISIIYLT